MKRAATVELIKWKQNPNRKPLLIRGARQVGKTWLMKAFGKEEYAQVAYVNLESNKSLQGIFTDNSMNLIPLCTIPDICHGTPAIRNKDIQSS